MSTADDVAQMQEELETMQPMLVEAQKETEVTMKKIAEDTVSYIIKTIGRIEFVHIYNKMLYFHYFIQLLKKRNL